MLPPAPEEGAHDDAVDALADSLGRLSMAADAKGAESSCLPWVRAGGASTQLFKEAREVMKALREKERELRHMTGKLEEAER